jgi:hypothetical protein
MLLQGQFLRQRPRLRPTVETCKRLALKDVRPLVKPGDETATLLDGTTLALRWAEVRGCYGDRPGRALLLVCPGCSRSSRVLYRPPAGAWGCWSCTPVSPRSHRRPGARPGRPKPPEWQRQKVMQHQLRCVRLLGLKNWPPDQLFWTARDVLAMPRRPDAPRISELRASALAMRLDVLDRLRMAAIAKASDGLMKSLGLPPVLSDDELAKLEPRYWTTAQILAATAWAVRRGPGDPRTRRRKTSEKLPPAAAAPVALATGGRGVDSMGCRPPTTRPRPSEGLRPGPC